MSKMKRNFSNSKFKTPTDSKEAKAQMNFVKAFGHAHPINDIKYAHEIKRKQIFNFNFKMIFKSKKYFKFF